MSEPPKKLMNSNVAIELGYALHTITDRRLIMVMNAHFGARGDLPFDLQHKAGPIFYDLAPDAAKDQITSARKQLAGDLKVALREMLPTIITQPSNAFQETAPLSLNPARYFAAGQPLVTRTGGPYGGAPQSFTVADTPTLYLRIVPTKQTALLKRADAYNVIRQGPNQLEPFYGNRSGSSFEPNEFGAIAFDANYDKGEILSAAQLFLNREIWAFNTISLSPELARMLGKRNGIPTLAVEFTFAFFLPTYVRFMVEKLGVAPPYRIEGGAFGVKDYVIFMPSNYVEQEWGPIHDKYVRWAGVLKDLEAKDIDAALLGIFEPFFDAGACTRPKKLYGFPGYTAGTLPHP